MQLETIAIPELETTVSGLWQRPEGAEHLLVLAHGAGAGMEHSFMEELAAALVEEHIAVLRFQFPYMERGGGPPDSPRVAHAAVRAAVAHAATLAPGLKLLAGGKSYGGRMISQVAAAEELPSVHGLVFYGFPLHPGGRPGRDRAAHLTAVPQPMLFLQGTRDRLAEVDLIIQVAAELPRASLLFLEGGDHSFRTLKRAGGIPPEQAVRLLAQWTKDWVGYGLVVER